MNEEIVELGLEDNKEFSKCLVDSFNGWGVESNFEETMAEKFMGKYSPDYGYINKNKYYATYGYKVDGKLIAGVQISSYARSFKPTNTTIEWLFVDRDYQGTGYGRKILEFIMDRYIEMGCEVFNLKTAGKSAFFVKSGFEKKDILGYVGSGFKRVAIVNMECYSDKYIKKSSHVNKIGSRKI